MLGRETEYFGLRGVSADHYTEFKLPVWLCELLDGCQEKTLLDFGCGLGQHLFALRKQGFTFTVGADISSASIAHVRGMGCECLDASNYDSVMKRFPHGVDVILLNHVLEHVEKADMISFLSTLRQLLNPNGLLIISVPNAQSATGCYWAYEDFTHHYLFTSGSLMYVLRAAGFSDVHFADIDCTAGAGFFKRAVKRLLLACYKLRIHFWNKVTGSAFHASSIQIYSYEIKAVARV